MSESGIHASSDATNVMTNSNGCNSPNCFLPISLITTIKNRYIRIVRIKIVNIAIVC